MLLRSCLQSTRTARDKALGDLPQPLHLSPVFLELEIGNPAGSRKGSVRPPGSLELPLDPVEFLGTFVFRHGTGDEDACAPETLSQLTLETDDLLNLRIVPDWAVKPFKRFCESRGKLLDQGIIVASQARVDFGGKFGHELKKLMVPQPDFLLLPHLLLCAYRFLCFRKFPLSSSAKFLLHTFFFRRFAAARHTAGSLTRPPVFAAGRFVATTE